MMSDCLKTAYLRVGASVSQCYPFRDRLEELVDYGGPKLPRKFLFVFNIMSDLFG